jgi:hypothetical protein
MAKPTLTEAEWNTDGTNETAPTATHKSDGWGLAGGGKLASSGVMNYWKRRVYLWLAWLNGLFGADGSLSLDVDASVTVSGAGLYKRPSRKRSIPACAGSISSGGQWFNAAIGGGMWQSTADAQCFLIPIILDEGEVLTSVTVSVAGDAGQTVGIDVRYTGSSGSAGGGGLTEVANSVAAVTGQNLTVDHMSDGVTPMGFIAPTNGNTYYICCITTGAPSGSGVRVGGAVITTNVS